MVNFELIKNKKLLLKLLLFIIILLLQFLFIKFTNFKKSILFDEYSVNFKSKILPTSIGEYHKDGYIYSDKVGTILYGPNISFKAGNYYMKVVGSTSAEDNTILCDVISVNNSTITTISSYYYKPKSSDICNFKFSLDQDSNNIEFRITQQKIAKTKIYSYQVGVDK